MSYRAAGSPTVHKEYAGRRNISVAESLKGTLMFTFAEEYGAGALTALLGVTMAAIATGATILANALGRDITEHLERMRSRGD